MYTTDGAEGLTEKLKTIKEAVDKVEAPDFTQKQSEEASEEDSEDETWGDEVEL